MNRSKRAKIAEETLQVIDQGSYIRPDGTCVAIDSLHRHSMEQSLLIDDPKHEEMAATITTDFEFDSPTQFEVRNVTTLTAAKECYEKNGEQKSLCLNFASAKNPGGGFRGGSQAQEESLVRSSGLYSTLISHSEMYEHNKSLRTGLYSHWMIYSPNVVVFRNDEGQLLNQPYPQSFLTAPAVNWSALKRNEPEKLELVEQVMSERIERVFNVAIHQQYQSLILGAWGCGVFGNSPQLVAGLFAKVLLDNPVYKNRFKHVVFAVLDRSSDESTIEPFKKLFQPAT